MGVRGTPLGWGSDDLSQHIVLVMMDKELSSMLRCLLKERHANSENTYYKNTHNYIISYVTIK